MWEPRTTADYEKCLKWYTKKRRRELAAALANDETYLKALRAGMSPQKKLFGFLHAEGSGVWAIDQKGGKGSLAEIRLYVYPHEPTETLYHITIGDKGSQKDDIKLCHEFVAALKKNGTGANDEPAKAEEAGEEPRPEAGEGAGRGEEVP
jgi:hypothetical protein